MVQPVRSVVILLTIFVAVACGGSTQGDPVAGGGSGGGSGSGGSSGSGGQAGSSGLGGIAGSGATAGARSWQACDYPGDCTLFATNCCGGYCSDVPINSFIPVNVHVLGAAQQEYCSDPVDCPDCMYAPHEHFIAACRDNQCVAVDIRFDAVSACNADQDCLLRYGSDCCEACNGIPQQLVAMRADGQLLKEVCGPYTGPCPPCAPPTYPAGASARCIAGHCQVIWEEQPAGGG